MTQRQYDDNGWYEVKDNPISKAGVFEYLGAEIDPDAKPDRIYKVWRPESEIASTETIDSFKLVPWVDDHEMLGEQGVPAEYKGVHGVTGEEIYYDKEDGYLKGNLKVFSDVLSKAIDSGKNELSLGYTCDYRHSPGVTPDGEAYDYIQHTIRGNHLASVDEGRMGKEVAVMDHATFTFDSAELIRMKDEETKAEDMEMEKSEDMQDGGMTMDAFMESVEKVMPMMEKVMDMMGKMGGKSEDMAKDMESDSMDAEADKGDEGEEKKGGMDSGAEITALKAKIAKLEAKPVGMDEKTMLTHISQRNALATSLETHVGTFDHSAKSLQEVAEYGVEKLGVPCVKGSEIAAINAALHVMPAPPARVVLSGQDSAGFDIHSIMTGAK